MGDGRVAKRTTIAVILIATSLAFFVSRNDKSDQRARSRPLRVAVAQILNLSTTRRLEAIKKRIDDLTQASWREPNPGGRETVFELLHELERREEASLVKEVLSSVDSEYLSILRYSLVLGAGSADTNEREFARRSLRFLAELYPQNYWFAAYREGGLNDLLDWAEDVTKRPSIRANCLNMISPSLIHSDQESSAAMIRLKKLQADKTLVRGPTTSQPVGAPLGADLTVGDFATETIRSLQEGGMNRE